MLEKSKQFLVFCCSFVVGVGLASAADIPGLAAFVAAVSFIALGVVIWKRKRFRIVMICLACAALGAARHAQVQPREDQVWIQDYAQERIEATGVICAEPDSRGDHVKLVICPETIRIEGGDSAEPKGKLLARAMPYPERSYGDRIRIQCFLEEPGVIEDFDYGRYLARFGIFAVCSRPYIELLESGQGSMLMRAVLHTKHAFLAGTNRALPEPHASFLAGLLLGIKRGIPEDIMEAFNATGTTHIVVVSGSNITIVSVVLLKLFQSLALSRRKSLVLVAVGIFLFVILSGAESSVIRAGIMGGLALLARGSGRMSSITNLLVFAGALMVAFNPHVLAADAGFQLSFLATAGLVYAAPRIERFFKWMPEKLGLRESLLATISATVMTTPLILYQFGRLSVVSPIANVLILPAIPGAMASGFAAGMASFLSDGLACVIGWVCWLFLAYMMQMAQWLASLPYASVNIESFGAGFLVASYGLIVVWLAKGRRRPPSSKRYGG